MGARFVEPQAAQAKEFDSILDLIYLMTIVVMAVGVNYFALPMMTAAAKPS